MVGGKRRKSKSPKRKHKKSKAKRSKPKKSRSKAKKSKPKKSRSKAKKSKKSKKRTPATSPNAVSAGTIKKGRDGHRYVAKNTKLGQKWTRCGKVMRVKSGPHKGKLVKSKCVRGQKGSVFGPLTETGTM